MPKGALVRGCAAIGAGAIPPVVSVVRDEYIFSRVDLVGLAFFLYGLYTAAGALGRAARERLRNATR